MLGLPQPCSGEIYDLAVVRGRSTRLWLQATVKKIVTNTALDDEMVQRLLDFKALADKAISQAFLDAEQTESPTDATSSTPPARRPNQEFTYALSDAFTQGFKARRNKPAEMIAKFLDKTMRKGQGATSDTAFESLLDAVLSLYRFTEDKDVFRTFYHRALAKRLLLEKSASDDFEAAMLKKLKESERRFSMRFSSKDESMLMLGCSEYDPEFGMGEDMFKDLALSRESMREYHAKLPEDSPSQKLSVMVLQRSAWPFTVQKTSVDLPPGVSISDFRLSHDRSRRLTRLFVQ